MPCVVPQHFSPAWHSSPAASPCARCLCGQCFVVTPAATALHGYGFGPGTSGTLQKDESKRIKHHQAKATPKQKKRKIRQTIFCALLRSPGCQFFLSTIKERVATARLTSFYGPLVGFHSLISYPVGPGSAQSVWAPCKPQRDAHNTCNMLQNRILMNSLKFSYSNIIFWFKII